MEDQIAEKDSSRLDTPREAASSEKTSRAVHLILQGKGGVGKSLVASLVAQWLKQRGHPVECVDTDPVQQTFASISALNAECIELLDEDKDINIGVLDHLIERIVSEDTNFVIDNGASSFLPFSDYLIRGDLFQLIMDHGKDVYVHTIIAGGPDIDHTVEGAKDLAEQFPTEVKLVLWLNPYHGSLRTPRGTLVTETRVFQDIESVSAGVVTIPSVNPKFDGINIRDALTRRMTFVEAMESSAFTLVGRRRIGNFWQAISSEIEKVLG